MRHYWIEVVVGVFIIAGLLALVALAFKVSGLTQVGNGHYYVLQADFDNVGDLKVRAPVSVSGVTVGRVSGIKLDPQTFRATVTLQMQNWFNKLPMDSSASILTQGLLGSNYISLTPGYEEKSLHPGQRIETTHSALILENLIGQLMFNLTSDKNNDSDSDKKGSKKNQG